MSEEVEFKTCDNCKLKIVTQNYVTHTLHCARHIQLCKKCGEPVPKGNLEEHLSLEHGNESCEICGKIMEKGKLKKHVESDCPKRLISCLYCDLELPSSDMTNHADYCGTRTEKCSECGEFVMLKYTQLHLDSNHKFLKLSDEPGPSASWEDKKPVLSMPKLGTANEESTLLPCEFCDGMFTPRELRRHQVSCTNGWRTAKPVLRKISVVKCRVCGKSVAANEYPAHLVVCEEEELAVGASFLAPNKASRNNGIPCDICERVVPFEEYESHHRTCSKYTDKRERTRKDSFVTCDVCDGSVPSGDYRRHRIFCAKTEGFSDVDSAPKLPCEFCGRSFSEDSLAAHQVCCSPVGQRAEIPCEICGDLKSLVEVFEHQLTCRISGSDY